jgi:hypothetical protein
VHRNGNGYSELDRHSRSVKEPEELPTYVIKETIITEVWELSLLVMIVIIALLEKKSALKCSPVCAASLNFWPAQSGVYK